MTNFSINFTHPWLLLLIIPAILLTIIPYFRMNKKYRATRNRIVSIVLHSVVMFLTVTVLAGVAIDYDKPNKENEVLLVVDESMSGAAGENEKNRFIQSVIESGNSMFRLGIVSFGFDQVYSAELTADMSSVYADYLNAPKPDTTATDIDAALTYSASLFENPETARIVLITDALETDGTASNAIKKVAAMGITVDTVFFYEDRTNTETQIVSVQLPNERLEVGKKFDAEITLESSFMGAAYITVKDNDVECASLPVDLKTGTQTVKLPIEFTLPGMHELSFAIECNGDVETENNKYSSYVYLEVFDRILIIEGAKDESAAISRALQDEMKVTVINIHDVSSVPETVNELREYDEIILCNVANSDLPDGFDKALQSYVRDFGGGLFTVCGHKAGADPNTEDSAHAYTREDMTDTIYQDMLPVEIAEYTPPAAIMILIDTSGSMYTDIHNNPLPDSSNKLKFAKEGAKACVDLLNERDYIGIMALAEDYTEVLPLTPSTQRSKIFSAIENIPTGSSTIFSSALERAGTALRAMDDVEKKHIIIITDGEPSNQDSDEIRYFLEGNSKFGITTSIIGVQCNTMARQNMVRLLTDYAGGTAENFHDVTSLDDASGTIKKDFEVNKIQAVNVGKFNPKIELTTSITAGIKQEDIPALNGFFGSRIKSEATMILSGRFAPLYSYWQYGDGRVGTFSSDLNGTWSKDFIDSNEGEMIIKNIVLSLLPSKNIHPRDIELTFDGDNYKTNLNIFTELSKGDYIEVTVTSPKDKSGITPEPQFFTLDEVQSASMLTFAVKTPGIHKIHVQKKDSEGALISENTVYKALSYSKEYDCFVDETVASDFVTYLAEASGGTVISEPLDVYRNAVTYRHIHIDPRLPFIIIAIVLFLLDIAVRKFKWKWPHEIIRDYKSKKDIERRASKGL